MLSFTNAAADNITAKNEQVGSMTIARMIHDIYSPNHPNHELSSIDTIINSLEIFFPGDDFASRFRAHLLRVDKNETHAFTAMNTLIERNYDQVIAALDRIRQTSMELEIIIRYQQIDVMAEPPHVRCRYLIIDEVQDNSIFEFIYVFKYVSGLISEKVYPTDAFSAYIQFFWKDALQVPPANASFVVSQGITDNLAKLTRNAQSAEMAVHRVVSNWWVENAPVITAWVDLHNKGGLGTDEFFERLRDNLLSYEIRHNAVRQSLMNQKNRERKQKNAEAKSERVVSTIHGAKGMEFDNVVVVHKEDTKMSEDVKRMYYVAFTRAINSEYVLSYRTARNAPIETNYQTLVKVLEERDKQAAMRAAGIDPDLLDDDGAGNGPAETDDKVTV